LDNVLLNTSRFTEIDPDTERQLQARLAAEATAKLHDHWLPELFRMDRLGIWVKLRPGVREFLRRCLDRFELWVYTSGTRPFAEAVVELIDPHGQLFSGRVIAQGNGVPDALSKILKTGLESRTAVSLILGDSSVSWMADRRNLFVVEQYLFFPSSRRKHGVLKGKSLLDINRCVVIMQPSSLAVLS
jgi:RNA polymerase II C-terminal domain phosphatase-like 3/4